MIQILIAENDANQRLDKFLRKYLNDAPLSLLYRWLRSNRIKVNRKKPEIDYLLQIGDKLELFISEEEIDALHAPKKVTRRKVTLDIIYEDKHILVVNKPGGIVVQEDGEGISLTADVQSYLARKGEYHPRQSNGFAPYPAHRLDRNTTGLVVFGKTFPALQALNLMFKEHERIEKEYVALVKGYVKKGADIDAPLLKDESIGRVRIGSIAAGALSAFTHYEPIQNFTDSALVRVIIKTGRTHQIRVHLASVDHPIAGDSKYGDFEWNKTLQKNLGWKIPFLHASQLTLVDCPVPLDYLTGHTFTCQLPTSHRELLERMK